MFQVGKKKYLIYYNMTNFVLAIQQQRCVIFVENVIKVSQKVHRTVI